MKKVKKVRAVSMRFDAATHAQLAEIAGDMALSHSAVCRLAIKDFYARRARKVALEERRA